MCHYLEDYCNSFYTGVSQCNISRRQLVQNAGFNGTKKFELITPVLAHLTLEVK